MTRRRADDQARRVGARDRADSAAGHGWPVSGTRPPAANPPQAGASPGCPFSWLLLFGQALRRRSGANGEAGPEGAEGRMPGVKTAAPDASRDDEAVPVPYAPRRPRAAPQLAPSMALKHVVLSPAPASGARLALRRLKIKSEARVSLSLLICCGFACRKASRAPQERGGARRGCLRHMDVPSYAPAPSFRGAQGTGAASSRRLASGTSGFWLLFAASKK